MRMPRAGKFLVLPSCCILLWGCTTTVHDLTVVRVSVTDSAEWFPPSAGSSKKEQTNRILRVDLTTDADLSQAFSRRGMLIHANVVFCGHPDDYVLLGSSLY